MAPTILLLVTIYAFVASIGEANQSTLPPTIIPGSHSDGYCPTEELLKMTRQNISVTVQKMISDKYHPSYFNCEEALQSGQNTSGVYKVKPDDLEPFFVYCDMETDGGGWTVFQKREDGSEDFYRGWDDYVMGFGNLTGEFWLGLEKIHRLTSKNMTTLRVDMGDFEGNTVVAKYSTFRVLNSSTDYIVNVAGYSGTAGDSLSQHNSLPFSTRDRENDIDARRNCAVLFKGGWWYRGCHWSNLNGLYHGGPHSSYADGVIWFTWRGNNYSLRFTEMKIRSY